MERTRWLSLMLAAVLLSAVPGVCPAEAAMGRSGGHDLDDLLERAGEAFDLSARDAVVLLERRHIELSGGRASSVSVHRVVWIGTSVGIRNHADLRIPWNSADSELNVSLLRTWREGRWWPDDSLVSPTAVVETLPFALASADDYTSMRETMLLHDGVELPCVLETAWEISWRPGAGPRDGLFVFPQADPAVVVELSLSILEGSLAQHAETNGAPPPAVSTAGMPDTRLWRMERLSGIGSGAGPGAAAWAPAVYWSCWDGWSGMGGEFSSAMTGALGGDALRAAVSERMEGSGGEAAAARSAAGLVAGMTRSVDYDWTFFGIEPRSADRTCGTAYGHRLDRAALAASVFEEAGLDAQPVFLSAHSGGTPPELPGFSGLEGPHLLVSGEGLEIFYDALSGRLFDLVLSDYGRAVWLPAGGKAPRVTEDGDGISTLEIFLDLEPDGGGGWSGRGWLVAGKLFSPWWRMCGAEDEAKDHLRRVAGSILGGAEITGWNPQTFGREKVAVGFGLEVPSSARDRFGRVRLEAGSPHGGIADALPPGIHPENGHRDVPVILPGPMSQTVRLRLELGGLETVRVPEPASVETSAGSFDLLLDPEEGAVTVERRLRIDGARIGPEEWSALRSLLLLELDEGSRVILLE